MKMPVNEIICGDCLEVMKDWPDNCVDLVVTSPPYNIGKEYDKHQDRKPWPEFMDWFRQVFMELKRVSRDVVLIIGTHNNLKFYTEARELLHLAENCRCIYMPTWSIVNPIELAVYCYEDNSAWTKKHLLPIICNGTLATFVPVVVGKANTEQLYDNHPCTFPTRFPRVFIEALTAKESIVFDPFVGVGTTAMVAKQLKRNYIGIDISEEYCEIARMRIKAVEIGVPVKEQKQGQIGLFE
ncbi:hypothetical protein LCGC14_0376170 [marine sediment metagenome]|uniref:site-specific DNA-methyltransferase (cytosine-N(4)-specific) n=1 Tax=marine sediment metagenome TaxID=412755 RepID=A0A0F9T9Q3_9ZZZZ